MPTAIQSITRNALATRVRNALYGPPARSLPHPLRWLWADICTQQRSSGALLAADVERVAATYALELRAGPPLVATPETDLALRVELAARLKVEAKRLNRPRQTAEQRRLGRIKTLAKASLPPKPRKNP